jgi:hypothetical protein
LRGFFLRGVFLRRDFLLKAASVADSVLTSDFTLTGFFAFVAMTAILGYEEYEPIAGGEVEINVHENREYSIGRRETGDDRREYSEIRKQKFERQS